MPNIAITVDASNVLRALQRLGVDVQGIARREVRAFGLDVTAGAKTNAPVKTGKLRRSINGRYTSAPGEESGVVGPNVAYARMVEQGFSGSENVKAFMRMQTMAWGRQIVPRQVQVHAFTRQVNRAANPYLVPAFEAAKPLSDRISEAMRALSISKR